MLGTNRQFETLLRSIDGRIAGLEDIPLAGSGAHPTLEDMRQVRRAVRLLLSNRGREAAKPVVDFVRWRDGAGALYLCAACASGAHTVEPRALARCTLA